MNDIESQLANDAPQPPEGLAQRTIVAAGAADEVASTDSPLGPVWVAWNGRGISAVSPLFDVSTVDDFAQRHRRHVYAASSLPRDLTAAIEAGLVRGETLGLPIDFRGLSPFQESVLHACATIPPGTVRPYNWIADEIGNPGSIRAVGTALGKNPIPLLVPCHRVVRSDGSVGQYAFGAERKHDLLVREGALLA